MTSAEDTPVIHRYVVIHNFGSSPCICGTFRGRDDAIERARFLVDRGHDATVGSFELRPNRQIVQCGVDRFDRMLDGVHNSGITLFASLDELIECGAIGSYVRDILGKSGCKSSCDEYGNRYYLQKTGKRNATGSHCPSLRMRGYRPATRSDRSGLQTWTR
ncbi:MAG: hypothetical protein WD672_15445 [Woeseia sp.]